MPEIYADLKKAKTEEEQARDESDYQKLYALFLALLRALPDRETREQALEELAALRADQIIKHAFEGFGIDNEEALQLLRNMDDSNLTQADKDRQKILQAAVDNLIDFAVCEEYQIYDEVHTFNPDFDPVDFMDSLDMDEYDDICYRYNHTYAIVENDDTEYAMAVAVAIAINAAGIDLTYMTQNDDRVRPWHYALQGFTAPLIDFPSWMIPPIEWGCRCYLERYDSHIQNSINVHARVPQKPHQLNEIFSESVAKGGRIFGKAHPYFQVKAEDEDMLNGMIGKLKEKYYGR